MPDWKWEGKTMNEIKNLTLMPKLESMPVLHYMNQSN